MQLDPKYKLEKAASKDASRPVLSCAYLDVDQGKMVATDSYCLAVVPVETGPDDVSGLVPAAALTAARKMSTRYTQAEVTANGSVEVKNADGSQSFARPDGKFPDWQSLVDRAPFTYDAADNQVELEPIAEFGIDAALLARLAEAIGAGGDYGKRGCTQVRVKVYSPNKPIRVEAIGSEGFGICMPVMLRD